MLMSNSMSKAQRAVIFKDRLHKVHGNKYKVIDEYTTGNAELKVRCQIHGIFTTTGKRLTVRGQGCPVCAVSIRSTNSTATRRAQQYDRVAEHSKGFNWVVIESREDYIKNGGKCSLRCFCGHTWQTTPKVAVKAKRCRVCANREVNKHQHVPLEKRLAAIDFVHDGNIVIVGHDGTYGAFECLTCSSLWKTKLSVVAGGSGCRTCAMKRITKSPKRIQYQIELCGKTHYVVGYEAHAIRALLASGKVAEEDINLEPAVFIYKYKGKTRRYIPDFQINNRIVEVKSLATAGLAKLKFASFSMLKAKARAVVRAGFKFNLMVMSGPKRINMPSDWLNMTRSEVLEFILHQEQSK